MAAAVGAAWNAYDDALGPAPRRAGWLATFERAFLVARALSAAPASWPTRAAALHRLYARAAPA